MSIAWLFQPGHSGWTRLTHFKVDYDPRTVNQVPEAHPVLDPYVEGVSRLPEVGRDRPQSIIAYHVSAAHVVELNAQIVEPLAQGRGRDRCVMALSVDLQPEETVGAPGMA